MGSTLSKKRHLSQSLPSGINGMAGAKIREKMCNLSLQNLSEIPSALLLGANEITHLDLSHNRGLQLSATIPMFINLKVLNLCDTRHISIPIELEQLTQLTTLNLTYNQLVTLPDCLGKLSSLTTLDLTHNQLATLPDCLGKLSSLTTLDLTDNQLTTLPNCLRKLSSLTALKLGKNKLTTLPDCLGKLSSLTMLDLTHNQIATLPDCLGKLSSLAILDLRWNKLTTLPDCVGKLSSLTTLDLRWNKLTALPDCLGKLSCLTTLNLWTNQLTTLPDCLGKLSCLTTLKSGHNQLVTLPDCLGKLSSLTMLDVRRNKLAILPDRLGKLSALTTLNLYGNELTTLPDCLGNLYSLTALKLGQNQIATLPSCLGKLSSLTILDLRWNKLATLPDCIGKLSALTKLKLGQNLLATLPDCLGKLSSLTTLDLTNNQLATLPDCLGKLSALTTLDLTNNQLSTLPDCLGELSALAKLVASNNCFENYPMVTMKLHLNELDLSNKINHPNSNAIRHLPLELSSNMFLRKLEMSGNPMVCPPLAICDLGIDAVQKYLKELSIGASAVCPQTVSMLGETQAGKTSIVMSLYDGKPHRASPDERTRVMSQTQIYHPDDRIVVINDFGGHPIYQTVLAVFLPPSGIGIIVYDMSKPLETQIEAVDHWMTTAFAKSPALKLIIVGSHLDCPQENEKDHKISMLRFVRTKVESTLKELTRHISTVQTDMIRSEDKIPAAALKSKHEALERSLSLIRKNTCPVRFVSCVSGFGIEDLRSLVFKMVGSFDFPAHWVKVIQKIVNPDKEKHRQASYLKMDEARTIYQEIVSSAQVSQNELNDDGLNIILVFLTQTCRILWKQNHPTLGDCIFHRVSHILEICKAVLHHDVLLEKSANGAERQDLDLYNRGLLTEDFLRQRLQPLLSSPCSVKVVVDLLTQFNLISLVKDSGRKRMFLVPSLLPTEPGNFKFSPHEPNIHARIDFCGDTIPLSFFETYAASVLQDVDELVILNADCWKDGVGFESYGVKLACRRMKDKDGKHLSEMVLDSSASASNVRNLCKVTWRVFRGLQKHIVHTWKGAYCRGYFPCPGCRLIGKDNFNSFPFDVELIGMDNSPKEPSVKCCTCGLSIPRPLVAVCFPEMITKADYKAVRDFFAMHGSSTGSAGRTLVVELQELRKNFPTLVKQMSDVCAIIDILYSKKVLSLYQKEVLEAHPVRHRQVGVLLNMLEQKSTVCIGAFVQALQDTNQHELVSLFQYTLAEDEDYEETDALQNM